MGFMGVDLHWITFEQNRFWRRGLECDHCKGLFISSGVASNAAATRRDPGGRRRPMSNLDYGFRKA